MKNNDIIGVANPKFTNDQQDAMLVEFKKALNTSLSMGPNVEKLENLFSNSSGASDSIAMNSCTSTIECALAFYNVKGKKVIVPSLTFSATAMAVVLAGGEPVFAEIDQTTMCLCPRDVESKIDNETVGVIHVHFSGYVAHNITEIRDVTERSGCFLIEDCAHAIGASHCGVHVGLIGDAGCFSFYPTKIATAAEAGILISKHDEILSFARSYQSRGRDLSVYGELYSMPGRNVRLSEFNAIVGNSSMYSLAENLSRRREIAACFDEAFKSIKSIETLASRKGSLSSFWKYLVFLESEAERDKMMTHLFENQIRADTMYTPLLHEQPYFKKIQPQLSLPKTENMCRRHICLPCHNHLTDSEVDFIISTVASC